MLLFWCVVGLYFYQIDFNVVDYFSLYGCKLFFVELMLCYLVYVDLLLQDVQDVVGFIYCDMLLVCKMFEVEGLCYQNYVDIFDVGFVFECYVNDLCMVCESVVVLVVIGVFDVWDDVFKLFVLNMLFGDFCVGVVLGVVVNGLFVLLVDDVVVFDVKVGDLVCVLLFKVKQG